MRSNLFRKSLVCGIIVLFIGFSVLPSISGNDWKIYVVEDKGDLEE